MELDARVGFVSALDSGGIVRWVNLTDNIAVRARPEQVLKAFDEMGNAGAR
jgi:hypothetical protein